MKQLKPTLRDWIFILIIIALTFFILYCSEQIDASKYPLIKNIIRQFATIVGVSGLTSIVLRRINMQEVVDSAIIKTGIAKDILYNGLFHLSPTFRSIDFREQVNSCNSNLDIHVIYASTWLKNNMQNIIKCQKEKKIKVRFCFLNPESKAADTLNDKFEEGDLKIKIKESLEFVQKLLIKEKLNNNERFKIFLQNHVPQHCIYRMDKKLYLITYVLNPGRAETPIFGFEELEGKNGLFSKYLNDLEGLLNSSSTKEFKIND